jgi:PAS domain S-box-containing protein
VPTTDEEQLARALRQLEATQQITHIGSWEWDVATNGVTWSDELYRIYGLEPRSVEITFESFLARVHPDDRERTMRSVRAALESGGAFAYPERIIRPDGTLRELETRGEALRDPSGRVTGLLGTCRDVTAERKREETLTLFEDVVHNVQIGLVVLHVEDPADIESVRLISFNPAAEAIARRPLFDMLGKRLREVIPYAPGGTLETLVLGVARDGLVREGAVMRSRDARDPNRAVSMKAFPLPASCVGVALEDTSEQTRSRRMREAEAVVLEMIVTGEGLAAILETLARAVDEELPGTAPAVVLFEHEGQRRYGSDAPAAAEGLAAFPIRASDGHPLGALELRLSASPIPGEWQWEILSRATRIAGIAIERRQLEEELRALSEHVESVREDERTGIAREIHDELGQALTALKMDIAWLGRRSKEREGIATDAVRDHLLGMSQLTDDIIQVMRRISAELRPGVLDDLGLLAAIEWQAQEFERRTGTVCTVRSNMTDARFERRLSTGIFRIFQEALTNVARHAGAKHVEVSVERQPGGADERAAQRDWIELRVNDDGVGIAPEPRRSRKSLGLLGIRERARNLGGEATIGPAQGRGTQLKLRVPYVEGSKGGR